MVERSPITRSARREARMWHRTGAMTFLKRATHRKNRRGSRMALTSAVTYDELTLGPCKRLTAWDVD